MSCTIASVSAASGRGSGAAARSSGVITASSCSARSVRIQSGTTQFTRTPKRSRSGPSVDVKRMSPALAAAYSGDWYGASPRPAVEAMLTIAPPARLIAASASWVARIAPRG